MHRNPADISKSRGRLRFRPSCRQGGKMQNCASSAVVERNRRAYLDSNIDLDEWRALADKIQAYSPDMVFLLARRMPRLWQLLRSAGIFAFDVKFASDFAIDHLAHMIKGKRIAVLDDAVRVGVAMHSALERIRAHAPQEVRCYALAANRLESVPQRRVEVTYRRELGRSLYQRLSARTARALWLLPRPYECEFPVFRISHADGDSFPRFLEASFGASRVHRLDIPEARGLGLSRFAVDLRPQAGRNDKLRLYHDAYRGELYGVPMAAVQGDVAKRFASSMSLREEFAEQFDQIGEWELSGDDTELLFGSSDVRQAETPERSADEPEFRMKVWPQFKDKVKKASALYQCFHNFFTALGEYAQLDISLDPAKLQMGPTFEELLAIMAELWEKDVSVQKMHGLVSELLDSHIDQGFVVAGIDAAGRRIFRKGEPRGIDHHAASILASLGIRIAPGVDMERIVSCLPEAERERFMRMVSTYEQLRTECL